MPINQTPMNKTSTSEQSFTIFSIMITNDITKLLAGLFVVDIDINKINPRCLEYLTLEFLFPP